MYILWQGGGKNIGVLFWVKHIFWGIWEVSWSFLELWTSATRRRRESSQRELSQALRSQNVPDVHKWVPFWAFPGCFPVFSWSLPGLFPVFFRHFPGLFPVFSRPFPVFYRSFTGLFPVLSRSFLLVFSRSFAGRLPFYYRSSPGLFPVFSRSFPGLLPVVSRHNWISFKCGLSFGFCVEKIGKRLVKDRYIPVKDQ